jgi:hypothetical protein
MGLLSASLSFSACDPDEEIETNDAGTPMAGEIAGELAGDVVAQPAYGVMPFAGDSIVDAGSEAGVAVPPYGSFGAEEAGEASPIAGDVVEMDMGIAGDDSPQPEYGAFPAGEEIEVDMSVSGDDSPQPDYGAFPAGEG